MNIYAGIDVGGTNIKIGFINDNFDVICKTSIETSADLGPDKVFEQIANAINELAKQNNIDRNDICAVGMGVPGPVNLKEGKLVNPPNLPGFEMCPVRQILSDKLGIAVTLENDANAAAWAEHECGKGLGTGDLAFITLGTGIGGGIISDGKLIHGHKDSAAELGHLIIYPDGRECACGQNGCAEAYASASNTARRAIELLKEGAESSLSAIYKKNGFVNCKEVFDAAEAGDTLAESVVDGSAKVLGLLCINIQNATNPEKIVFAGGMIEAGDFLLEKIRFYFDYYVWPSRKGETQILFSTVGVDAGLIGAAALARREYLGK